MLESRQRGVGNPYPQNYLQEQMARPILVATEASVAEIEAADLRTGQIASPVRLHKGVDRQISVYEESEPEVISTEQYDGPAEVIVGKIGDSSVAVALRAATQVSLRSRSSV